MKSEFRVKLAKYMDAGFPIIYVDSYEEEKIDSILKDIAEGREVIEWNGARGLVDFDTKVPQLFNMNELPAVLDLFLDKEELERKIIVLKDCNSYIENPEVIAKLKNMALLIGQGVEATIIIISTVVTIPPELEKYITILEMGYLSAPEIRELIQDFINENNLPMIGEQLLSEFALAFKGLSEFEINNLLALAYSNDGELTKGDLSLIFDQKQQTIKKSGILEMIPLKESLEDIGGLDNMKNWLKKKARVFKNIEAAEKFGVDMPKGILVAGIPGCGKSLSAKAIAHLFDVPLLRLDMGRLMGKYVGESEAICAKQFRLQKQSHPASSG